VPFKIKIKLISVIVISKRTNIIIQFMIIKKYKTNLQNGMMNILKISQKINKNRLYNKKMFKKLEN